MKEPKNDDERLSALLDGRVDGREREELLAHLAASDDDYYVFTDTASILRELEEAEAGADEAPEDETERVSPEADPEKGVIPLRPGEPVRARRRAAAWTGVALAAVLAGVVLVPALTRDRAPAAGGPVQLADRLGPATGLPEGWAGRALGRPTRGDETPAAAVTGERAARAVQAGALLVRLSVAVGARDAEDTQLLAGQVHSRFDARAGAAGSFRQIGERAGAPADSLRPLLQQGTQRISGRMERDYLRLGAWAEAGSLAAHARDDAFFRAEEVRTFLESAEKLTADKPAAAAAVARIRGILEAQGTRDWDALRAAFDTLLYEAAS
ncbi:zf-HC2 domain-containing protein [Longimicrobium sp.]|uniref:zf-HC2 domain-containing protein n=1 Tax=Longimicrobium sp. TaxID=2029185 RepID=UPI003B3BE494